MRTGISRLDVKLGFRMLVKYPGLTLVGGLAMAFAIWAGAGTFEFVMQVVDPTLPLDEGDRIVGIQHRDAASAGVQAPTRQDFATWREELDAVEGLGAFRTVQRNLITGEGQGEPVEAAAMSASGFQVARVPPLLGRTLVEADERVGASPVAVIGYDLWQRRFAGDPDLVGRTVRLASEPTTIVGVMPEGFAFPVNHDLWIPLRDPPDHVGAPAPAVRVFGRLAPGATLAEARAELEALGRRAAADFPDTHRHLRPTVLPYAESIFPIRVEGLVRAGAYSIGLLGVLLIVLMCSNVALLLFARAAARESELAVRHALGAGRGRIIAQLFTEALVLGGVAAIVGLAAAGLGLGWWFDTVVVELADGWRLPFWFDAGLSPATILYAGALTVLGAAVAGVVPALKTTRGLESRLRQATAGGGGFRFGGVWTGVIVAQVAITVFIPVFAYVVRADVVRLEGADVGFAEEEFLTARLELDRTPPGASADTSAAAFVARFVTTSRELERRLLAEPGVTGVTFADRLPRMYHPWGLIEVDEGGAAPPDPRWPAYRVSSASVAPDYFDVLGVPILAGRGFRPADVGAAPGGEPEVVVVNRSFVERVLGGRNPIGRRLRYTFLDEADARFSADEPGPWHEIVGVVPDLGFSLGVSSADDPKVAGFYRPAAPGAASPVHMAVHVWGDPTSLAPRLRRLATAVDPSLRLHEIVPMDELSDGALAFLEFWLGLIALVIAITLLLSLAGIYSVMSFTVSQRTREIGIRLALGADRRRLVLTIFRRPLTQVALGIAAGAAPIAALVLASAEGASTSVRGAALVSAYAASMLAVCTLACVVPTRRALRVEPTEALKADG